MNTAHEWMNHKDHVMANTWRLIFEARQVQTRLSTSPPPLNPNFSRLEAILPEYRLIGLEMAATPKRRYQ